MRGTPSLKALAYAVLQRDTARDSERDTGQESVPQSVPAVGRPEGSVSSVPHPRAIYAKQPDRRSSDAWDPRTAALVKWFLTTSPPPTPFELCRGVTVAIPAVYWEAIRRDIAALEAEWRKELIDDPIALKAHELAEIEEAEAECWLQYEDSHARDWLAELRGWKGRKARLLGLDYRAYKQSPGSSEDKTLDTQETNGFDVSKLSDDELETICFIFESHMDS